ncbi:MAG TPA: alginate export family protein [Bacteroidales bacterium]|nr:alginate export family protein [Bacteroidales bacterium]
MKKVIINFTLALFITLSSVMAFSQTTEISGQFRPRYEYRHGFKTLIPDGQIGANFVSQRTRINLKYSDQFFRLGFSLQNVGVWGETGTLSIADVNGTAFHEAWGEILFSEKFSMKVGRQEIIYDDHRIFGSVDWAQQGRSHDAAIISIKPKDVCKLDIGFAYNARRESLYKEYYHSTEYRTFQYIHWHRDFNQLGVSVLLLNNGMTYLDMTDTTSIGDPVEKIAYSQTLGTRITYSNERFAANGAFYFQTGKISADTTNDGTMESSRDLSGLYFAGDIKYNFNAGFSAGAGFEYLSGNSMKDPADKDEAFKPFYGTNHKFNGWMDYFYVGNHMQSVGLLDINIPLAYKKNKITVMLIPHFFQSTGDIVGPAADGIFRDYDKYLGTEVDLAISYAISPIASIKAGYSQMFATESMQILKGGNKDNTNNWAWVMIDLKPTFFKFEN